MFAELGLKVGTRRIARMARRMGIRTPVSTNPAMTLGGLKEGVTPLEMAYAYSTIANKGVRACPARSRPASDGPVGIEWVEGHGVSTTRTRSRTKRVFPESVGETAQQLLAGVVTGGTGKAAQIGEFAAGKTGTTENYGDAWFVGFNKELTVAVWVGYPDQPHARWRPSTTASPVAGGTFPAEIWRDLMLAWIGHPRPARSWTRARTRTQTTRPPRRPWPPGRPATAPSTTPEDGAAEDGGAARAARSSEAARGHARARGRPPHRRAPRPRLPRPAPPPATPAPEPGGGGGDGGAVAP